CEITCAKVVFPTPGGPHRITEEAPVRPRPRSPRPSGPRPASTSNRKTTTPRPDEPGTESVLRRPGPAIVWSGLHRFLRRLLRPGARPPGRADASPHADRGGRTGASDLPRISAEPARRGQRG